MTKTGRLPALALAAVVAFGGWGVQAHAAPVEALGAADVRTYQQAFAVADSGDFARAEQLAAQARDPALLGRIQLQKLMSPTYKATYPELAAWLAAHGDQPGAERVYALAQKKRRPSDPALPVPAILPVAAAFAAPEPTAIAAGPSSGPSAARSAYFSGDAARALRLAKASGQRWIAGLSAWRLKSYAEGADYFEALARDAKEDDWVRAGGAYWGARCAERNGDAARAQGLLKLAAKAPHTFYGMIAERRLALEGAGGSGGAPQSIDDILQTISAPDVSDLFAFVRDDARAHRAVALMQAGRATEAGQELRAGAELARTAEERRRWTSLAVALSTPLVEQAQVQRVAMTAAAPAFNGQDRDYPTPELAPKWGFTIDKALVYAIVNQESRFRPDAHSRTGATGLMQLMPVAAARAAGDDKLLADQSPLLDPAFNLRVGQDYVTWLMERGVGYDLLQVVAAYNGGPGSVLNTAKMLGDDADSLLLIESLPAGETRDYVEKVVAGYWTYRKMFGQEGSRTLDAVARGDRIVDARLDFRP